MTEPLLPFPKTMHLLQTIPAPESANSINLMSEEALNSIPKSLQFISKIGNTILRYRVECEESQFVAMQPQVSLETELSLSSKRFRTKSERVRNRGGGGELLHSRTLSEPSTMNKLITHRKLIEELKLDLDTLEFWKNGIPIHIDIYSKLPNACYLLERWVLSFQQAISTESLDGAQSPSSTQHDDMTDLILLIQSLYAEIRSLPLASALAQNSVTKGDLAFGISFAHGAQIKYTSPFKSDGGHNAAERAFHPQAKLAVFKFRPAAAPLGNLCMNVVHDLNLSGLSIPSLTSQLVVDNTPFRRNSPPSLNVEHLDIAGLKLYDRERKRRPSSGVGSIISAGSFVISPSTENSKIQPPQQDSSSTAPYDHQQDQNSGKVANAPDSPFPSPKAQKRALSFAHSISSRQESASSFSENSNSSKSQRPIPPPIRIRSNLHFNLSFQSSSSDGADEVTDNQLHRQKQQQNNNEHMQMLTPDGIEIHRSSLPADSPISLSGANKRLVSRRDSIPSAASDLFGTFVGSYEESILIGRLSTSPSRPVPFLAEIGVLAIGKCKPSLKCPPHLTLGFSAFFYQLPDEDVPTPYVGTIDMNVSGGLVRGGDAEKLASSLPECLGYRLPLKGQLQIMIKNPSCTAIKVFLIPYDFRDMPPNTKTFIRQKSYAISSKSPSSDPVARRSSLSGDNSTSLSNFHPDRLKFAIHLHFQMTSKKSLYLTSQLRLVFSPRPLDGDEKLKIVYQAPNFPKYQALTPLTMTLSTSPSRIHQRMDHDYHEHHWQNGGLAPEKSVESVVGQPMHEAPLVQGR